jgi:hypothetical protein
MSTLLPYLAPLVVVVSLVYGATRHELMVPILWHALRAAGWILGFMAMIFVVLFLLSWRL